ncbi:MAG TPA: NUDIX domain-containing protein [Candidatus Kapabacteria bacterium]|nr:NUDIX domain-containing protein [Candidatus Kapabacteria bacterium]
MRPDIPEGYRFTKKVLAYLTQGERLLVFQQPASPTAGIQVPAGTIEANEQPLEAIIREVTEETGLTDFIINSKLGIYYYDMSAFRKEIQERHVYHIILNESTPSEWRHFETDGGKSIEQAITFDFFWIPIDSSIQLAAGQGLVLSKLSLRTERGT